MAITPEMKKGADDWARAYRIVAEQRDRSFRETGKAYIDGVLFTLEEWEALKDMCITYTPQADGMTDEEYTRQCSLADRDAAREALRWQEPELDTQRKPFWRSWIFYAAPPFGSIIIIKLLEN